MLDKDAIKRILSLAQETGAEFAEVFFEDQATTTLIMEDKKVKQVVLGSDIGVGIRVIAGETVGYAYTDDTSEKSVAEAAKVARAVATGSAKSKSVNLTQRKSDFTFTIAEPSYAAPTSVKANFVREADAAAWDLGDAVRQVNVGYTDYRRIMQVANSLGVYAEDEWLCTRFWSMVTAGKSGNLQFGMSGIGRQAGLEMFRQKSPEQIGRESAETAIRMLDAVDCPAGTMPVVMANGDCGILVHEACGHCLEGDFVANGTSPYVGKLGEMVAAPHITVVDDGVYPNASGSYHFDDEGTPSERTVLIDHGKLTGYMYYNIHAKKMGVPSTGNGRRQSYRHYPLVRMRTTCIENGTEDPKAIVADTKSGLYVKTLGGGQADLGKGDFLFTALEAYKIENGEITVPVKGATLIGNGFEVLQNIDALGNDFVVTEGGRGGCGKMQTAIVSFGQPTLRIPSLTIGGTAV